MANPQCRDDNSTSVGGIQKGYILYSRCYSLMRGEEGNPRSKLPAIFAYHESMSPAVQWTFKLICWIGDRKFFLLMSPGPLTSTIAHCCHIPLDWCPRGIGMANSRSQVSWRPTSQFRGNFISVCGRCFVAVRDGVPRRCGSFSYLF